MEGTLEECLKMLEINLTELIPIDKMEGDPQFGFTLETYKNELTKDYNGNKSPKM